MEEEIDSFDENIVVDSIIRESNGNPTSQNYDY